VSHKLLVKDQQGEREVLLIDTVAVGRDPRCDISLADPLVSRRHAEFVASGQSVVVRDLGSRNGILVNGRQVQEAVLRPGDVVQVSQAAVTFLSSVEAATIAVPRQTERDSDRETVNRLVAAVEPPGQDHDKTSLLTPGEIEAIAAASGAPGRTPPEARNSKSGAGPAASGQGDAKRSGSWSVLVQADDNRTRMLPPQPETLGGDVVILRADTGPVLLPRQPAVGAARAVRPAPTPEGQAATAPAAVSTVWLVARIVSLVILCFAFGVTSTMIWLQPPLTVRWLLIEHAPVAVLLSFALAVAAGVVTVVAVRNAVRRAETRRETPVA